MPENAKAALVRVAAFLMGAQGYSGRADNSSNSTTAAAWAGS